MKMSEIYKLINDGCPGRNLGWCDVVGGDPCDNPENCPFVYWFGMVVKINKAERQAKENKGGS